MLKFIPKNKKKAIDWVETYKWLMEDQHRIYSCPITFIKAAIYVHEIGIISNGKYESCWSAFRQIVEGRYSDEAREM